jgi:4-diphosphocytidyl-2-C-methyl-D-erythritol kinase
MLSFPNAKINLGLNIINKMPNGYHTIESVFYPTDLCDALEILPATQNTFATSGIYIAQNAQKPNLCQQAYSILKKYYDLPPVAIHLHKHIPIGAGLGGGSADAAFVLKMLNEQFALNVTHDDLCAYAAELGSDCSFFIKNMPAYLYGAGKELVSYHLDLKAYYLVIVYPNIHVNTTKAYQYCQPHTPDYDLKTALQQPISTWKDVVKNDFEVSVFQSFPRIKKIKDQLYQHGALYAAMSGSGSAVLGIFEAQPDGLQQQFIDCICHQSIMA